MSSPADSNVEGVVREARAASVALRVASTAKKDAALRGVAARLRSSVAALIEANAQDLENARVNQLSAAMVDRLTLTPQRVEAIARAVEEIVALPDPVGRVDGLVRRPSGITVGRMNVPLGVIAMIYEARPNVTIDAAALCLKSGNSVVLRGGKEAAHSNAALAKCVHEALHEAGLPRAAVTLVPTYAREATKELLSLSGLIDVVIPRGGPGLVQFVAEHARIPVIAHYQGVCHLFVDAGAKLETAIAMVVDGKAKRPGVCNALECLLVERSMVDSFLPPLMEALAKEGVEVRADERAHAAMKGSVPAKEDDFGREFLAKILAVRVVEGFDAAIEHVGKYGSGHTESILTPSYEHAQRWLREVDASCVLVNASTRFNDGGELGLGAELGIATSKLHAYGPMGLDELTTRKWIVYGDGEVRG
ncbi:MAG: glutamate-5-semialdehyde dehydrogenase [Polyangiales bacterium]